MFSGIYARCWPPCRDAGGYLYYIPPPDTDSLVQIDLSDDAIVAQLFANHAWEELIEPLEVLACKSMCVHCQGVMLLASAGRLCFFASSQLGALSSSISTRDDCESEFLVAL